MIQRDAPGGYGYLGYDGTDEPALPPASYYAGITIPLTPEEKDRDSPCSGSSSA